MLSLLQDRVREVIVGSHVTEKKISVRTVIFVTNGDCGSVW
jgi:hypothetical protein